MLLVMPAGDPGVDVRVAQRFAGAAALDHQLQLVAGVEALHLPRRVPGGVVPQPVLVAVGVEDHRSPLVPGLQAVRIQLGLLLTHLRTLAGALGLHHRQRQPVLAPQHIVDIAGAVSRRHPADLELAVPRLLQRPARLRQHQVDEGVPGLGFVVIAVVDNRICRLGRGDLCHQLRDPGVLLGEVFVLGRQRLRMGGVLFGELLRQRRDLIPRQRGRSLRQRRIEHRLRRRRLRVRRMVQHCPHHDVVQLPHRVDRDPLGHRLLVMHRGIAQPPQQIHLPRDTQPDLCLEPRIVDPRRQVVGIGNRKPENVVQVLDQSLHRPAAVDARRPRITERVPLRPNTIGVGLRPLHRLKKPEVRHQLSPSQLTREGAGLEGLEQFIHFA